MCVHCRASDIRAQAMRSPGVRTRIRSGALPPTAGRVVLADDSAAQPSAVQVSVSKASSTRRSTAVYNVSASTVVVEIAENGPATVSRQSPSTEAASAGAGEAASGSSGKEAAPAKQSRAGARGQGKPAASTLADAKAKMSRFGRLLRGSRLAAAADSTLQNPSCSLSQEAEDTSLPAPAPDEALPVDLSAAQCAGDGPTNAAASADALVSRDAVRAGEDKLESAGRGRKRPSPKKAPGPLGFRARRAPRSELFVTDKHAAAKAGKFRPTCLPVRHHVDGDSTLWHW